MTRQTKAKQEVKAAPKKEEKKGPGKLNNPFASANKAKAKDEDKAKEDEKPSKANGKGKDDGDSDDELDKEELEEKKQSALAFVKTLGVRCRCVLQWV